MILWIAPSLRHHQITWTPLLKAWTHPKLEVKRLNMPHWSLLSSARCYSTHYAIHHNQNTHCLTTVFLLKASASQLIKCQGFQTLDTQEKRARPLVPNQNITINLHTQNSGSSPSLRYFTFVDKTLFIPVLPPPFTAPLSFPFPSLTNYPSPCVRHCMHIENLDCESSQMFCWMLMLQRFVAEYKVHSLTRSSHIWKCLHQAKRKLLRGREPLEATGSNVGWWGEEKLHFFTLTQKWWNDDKSKFPFWPHLWLTCS